MRSDSVTPVAQGKRQISSRSRRGGLTCSEGQVDDVLSKGESTEVEPSLSTETQSTETKPGGFGRQSRVKRS